MEFEVPGTAETQAEAPRGNPLYERQAPLGLIGVESGVKVALVGCGGVGCWVALSLVLGGVSSIELFDEDTISIHNLNRFPLPPSSVGQMKSLALASWLSTLRPASEVEIVARGMFDPAFHHEAIVRSGWLICATDSLKSRRMCYKEAQDTGVPYLEVGADGQRWTLSPAPPEFSTELEDAPGYQVIPVHVGPCMMAGAAAAYYVLNGVYPTHTIVGDWKKYANVRALGLQISQMCEVQPRVDTGNQLDVGGIPGEFIEVRKVHEDDLGEPELTDAEVEAIEERMIEEEERGRNEQPQT